MRPVDVAVVGTARVDLVVEVPRLPGLDETVTGAGLQVHPGGHGLGQAAAVTALGGAAALVARVGDDPWGRLLLDAIGEAGIDAGAVHVVAAPTGAAVVERTPCGGTAMLRTTSPGSTHDPGDIAGAARLLRSAPVTLVALELSAGTVATALALVAGAGRRAAGTLLGARPLPGHQLELLDPLVVTAAEAGLLLGDDAGAVARDPAAACAALRADGPRSVVVALPDGGAAWADRAGAAVERGPGARVERRAGARVERGAGRGAGAWAGRGAGVRADRGPGGAASERGARAGVGAGPDPTFLGALALTLARRGTLGEACAAGVRARVGARNDRRVLAGVG